MQLPELRGVLRKHPATFPRFVLPSGDFIPDHVHVTEVGYVVRNFIDCGGQLGKEESVLLQTHVGTDTEHRLTSERFAKILGLGRRVLPNDGLNVEIEYDCCVVARYLITAAKRSEAHLDLILENKRTQCRARERAAVDHETSCCAAAGCC